MNKFEKIFKPLRGKSLAEIRKRICGKKIGRGLYRTVYLLKADTNFVVKIEGDPSRGDFANVAEWRNYINSREWKWLEKWLAPCEGINETGQILIQQRVEFRNPKDYPKKVPIMFTDLKHSNFGWIADRFCCCDYSFLIPLQKAKLKRAKWFR